ncbi:hypothetical protein [Nocardia sp. NBC_01388]|uniref:YunG family protein n=1 Tax=Nocardia sp. NBC_01388 TaxID=2903596 RepID=UPI0032473415
MSTVAIETLTNAVERSWSVETAAGSGWMESNPAKGQCAVTACVVQDYLGGEIIHTDAELPGGGTVSHYFNVIDDELVDLTRQQFPDGTLFSDPMPKREHFASTREYCLSYDHTRRRYDVLSGRVAECLATGDR